MMHETRRSATLAVATAVALAGCARAGPTAAEARSGAGMSGGIHTRSTFARASDSRWLAIPRPFNMIAFNDIAREFEPRTIRWLAHPHVYIDTRPEGLAAGPELDQRIAEVREAAAGFVSSWSRGAVTAVSITVTSSPPPDATPGTTPSTVAVGDDPWVCGAPDPEDR